MKCEYRNCSKNIGCGRTDKLYCCVQCKRNEKKYRYRLKKKLENGNSKKLISYPISK